MNLWKRLPKKTKEEVKQFDKEMQEMKLERKDRFALWLSAVITFFPPVLLVLAFFALLAFLFVS